MQLQEDLELARIAARRAGAITMRYFGRAMDVEMKGPDQPLTQADLDADALLRDELAGGRPGYGWLSEESTATPDRLQRRRVWIVDPIDGTRSFIAGRPEYAVSIGLVEDGTVVAGVVYNPARDEMFWAARGGGAWLEVGGGGAVRLSVNADSRRLLLASRAEIAGGEFDGLPGGWRIEPQGSTAYKLALVAAGRADAFLSRGPKSEWDVCGGALVVTEAGGRVTDMHGAVPAYNRADPHVRGVVAASAAMHETLLAAAAALPPTGRMRGRGPDPARAQPRSDED